jgi:hypothetical protein
MAAKLDRVRREKVLQRALQLATEAMDLLDAHATEPEAAAYIALAQERLRTALIRH